MIRLPSLSRVSRHFGKHNNAQILSSMHFHALGNDEGERRRITTRGFHSTARKESMIILGGLGALTAAVVGQKILEMATSKGSSDSSESSSEVDADNKNAASDVGADTSNEAASSQKENTSAPQSESRAKSTAQEKDDPAARAKARAEAKKKEEKDSGKSGFIDELMTEIYGLFGKDWKEAKSGFFSKNFYDGGFEDTMTRREAALILGVRENTATTRIKDAHRRVLLLNHPDRGGSPYVAAKINLAKDLLMKGK
jgi:hypothetical protein